MTEPIQTKVIRILLGHAIQKEIQPPMLYIGDIIWGRISAVRGFDPERHCPHMQPSGATFRNSM